jgi:hypothetical protein
MTGRTPPEPEPLVSKSIARPSPFATGTAPRSGRSEPRDTEPHSPSPMEKAVARNQQTEFEAPSNAESSAEVLKMVRLLLDARTLDSPKEAEAALLVGPSSSLLLSRWSRAFHKSSARPSEKEIDAFREACLKLATSHFRAVPATPHLNEDERALPLLKRQLAELTLQEEIHDYCDILRELTGRPRSGDSEIARQVLAPRIEALKGRIAELDRDVAEIQQLMQQR